MSHFQTVSIVLPVHPGGSVESALEGIRKLDFPPENVEVIVAEGCSPSQQRNQAVEKAQGDLILFLDNDSRPRSNWLEEAERAFTRMAGAVMVGGPNVTPDSDDFFQHLFGCALASQFAHASMACRYRPMGEMREGSEKELILCGLAVYRRTFEDIGGFDETLFPNEENEFMNRLSRSGHLLVYHPGAIVDRSRRKKLSGFIKQMHKYGRGRMEQTFVERFHPANSFFLAPLFFSVYALTSPIWGYFIPWPPLFIPFLLYLVGGAVSGVGFAKMEKRPLLAPLLPFTYLLMHMSYSVGLLTGLTKRLKHGKGLPPEGEVTIRVVKDLGKLWKS